MKIYNNNNNKPNNTGTFTDV